MTAHVVEIYTAATAGAAMRAIPEATLEAGRGLLGDRYYAGQGTFSERLDGKPDVEITLIAEEEVIRFNQAEGLSVGAGELRRNVVTRGIALNDLVGARFRVGTVVLEGIRLCEPCAHLAKLVSPRVLPSLVHRAGLRARIVSGGVVRPGDPIVREPAGC
jgi:MOSC domain-containing protein YiiM